jgi:methionyl-tRNA formyltransferase
MKKMNKYIILSEKSWNSNLKKQLELQFPNDKWILINRKEDFNIDFLMEYKPSKIFIPHWSYILSSDIYNNYECVVFHMTDLPFGRGGSPLQNLISRGYKRTKISAIKVQKGIDTGDVYLKKELDLKGTASEIFERANFVIEKMIHLIIKKKLKPIPQVGDVVEFKRREVKDSSIKELCELDKVYDYIRMLDCEGYPSAFIETSCIKFEFTKANFDVGNQIIFANVRIIKK